MATEKFRRQLRQEVEHWWKEGLIDANFYETLANRYQFRGLEKEASNRFLTILMGLGGVLLGLGLITFVAANWQEWSRLVRVVVLLGLFTGVNVGGFYLWRSPKPGLQRFGHGLLLLGALILGANLGLMSQMFHQSGPVYHLYVVWGLGVMAMAYGLRLTSMGVLALILLNLAFWSQYWDYRLDDTWFRWLMFKLPLLMAIGFVPLAYWCQSRVIFGISAITFAISWIVTIGPGSIGSGNSNGWLAAIAFTLPPALLWVFHSNLWKPLVGERLSPRQSATLEPFQPIARSLTVWFLGILFYWFSFHWFWHQSTAGYDRVGSRLTGLGLWSLAHILIFLVLTGLGWLQLAYELRHLRVYQAKSVNSGLIFGSLVMTGAVFFFHYEIANLPTLAPFLINVLLFLLAIALIRDGLAYTQRHTFWGGMILLVLGILSRMLEYNTDLMLKSFVFILCGIGVLTAGFWFERNIKTG